MSGPNLHEWQRAKLQGMGEPQQGAVMPMTAPHSADRDQWLMKGFGCPPDISHSVHL